SYATFVNRGGVFVDAGIRGGSEYGETWHEQGMLARKQTTFDDMIAVAEWLIAQKYTVPAKLAIEGGSNGGLTVGAVITQRPDLFRAAVRCMRKNSSRRCKTTRDRCRRFCSTWISTAATAPARPTSSASSTATMSCAS